MSNSKEFTMAAEAVKHLRSKPNDGELLKLYGLYKQATVGDNKNETPGFLDFKGKSKHNAWLACSGKDQYTAEVEYITVVNELIQQYGIIEE